MINDTIRKYIDKGNTLLGIGPMSINTVDAAIEIANETDIPIMLIASRRQIDDENIKRGYVNNWTTTEFAKYVQNKKKKNNIILARDHGGPWQNDVEISQKLNLKEAMILAKESYLKDIEAGFNILHIDPSIDIFEQLSFDKIFERLTELYNFCSDAAIKQNIDIDFEIGTEEQMVHLNSLRDYIYLLNKVNNLCNVNALKRPLFIVSQIGTKVMEQKNIGILNIDNNKKLLDEIKNICNTALSNGIYVKVHNTDYLKKNLLEMFPSLKISAANVAPEFGVCETKSFINLLEKYYLLNLENDFLEMAYSSNKWKKWVMLGSQISLREKAILAGHYVFSDDNFIRIKEKAQKNIKNINIDEYLKESVKNCILNYISCFSVKVDTEEQAIC